MVNIDEWGNAVRAVNEGKRKRNPDEKTGPTSRGVKSGQSSPGTGRSESFLDKWGKGVRAVNEGKRKRNPDEKVRPTSRGVSARSRQSK